MLQGVTKGRKQPPGIVLYGPPKVGKSTFASESEAPIFVPTEDGINNVEVDQFPRATSWTALLAAIDAVVGEAHGYKTLVIDTINGAVELAAQHVCTTKFKGDWGPGGYGAYGQGQAATSEEVRSLMTRLDAAKEKGLMVILLAHTGVQSVKNPIDGDFTKFAPEMDRRVWSRFAAWADIIMRADYDYVVRRKEGQSINAQGRAIGSSTRILRCSGSAAEDAGTRVGWELPDTLPLSWADFAAALGKDTSIVDEVKELFKELPKDKQEATFTWLGTRDLARAPITKMRELLNRLRATQKKEKTNE